MRKDKSNLEVIVADVEFSFHEKNSEMNYLFKFFENMTASKAVLFTFFTKKSIIKILSNRDRALLSYQMSSRC